MAELSSNQSIQHLNCVIDDFKTTVLAFIDDVGSFVGTVSLDLSNKRSASIRKLFVNQYYRHHGIGTQLINRCCELAKANGCDTIGLLVKKENESLEQFYRKLGFEFVYQYDDGDCLLSKRLKD